jgi:hypothetical protein
MYSIREKYCLAALDSLHQEAQDRMNAAIQRMLKLN